MKIVSVSHEPRIKVILEMIRDISSAATPGDAYKAFAMRLAEIRPIEHMIGISAEGLPAGRYRILYNLNLTRLRAGPRGREELDRELGDPLAGPVRSGGFLAQVLEHPEPCLIHKLSIPDDPVLGTALAAMRSCMIAPVYVQGKPTAWAVSFNADATGLSVADLDHALLTGTLMDATARQIDARAVMEAFNVRLKGQLVEVARLQRSLLPRKIPQIPGLEIAVSCVSSDFAGGDYYDFIAFPDGTWGLLIADVSGHGAAAATVMAMLHTLFHSYRGRDRSPSAMLRHAHRHLLELDLEGTFVTAFFGVYNPRTGHMTFCRAGHCPPLRRHPRTGRVAPMVRGGAPPLGIEGVEPLADARTRLRPGEVLLLYTDGVTEAFSDSREMFGPQRLDGALRAADPRPDRVVRGIRDALHAFCGDRRHDDQTLVAIRRAPEEPPAVPAPLPPGV